MREFKLFVVVCFAILATEQALSLFPGRVRASVQPSSPILASLTGRGASIGIAVPDDRAGKLVGGTGGETECSDWDVEWFGCGGFYCPADFSTYNDVYWIFAEHPYAKQNSMRDCNGGHPERGCDQVIDSIIGCAT